MSSAEHAIGTLVIQLTIALPRDPHALVLFTEALDAMARLPGAAVATAWQQPHRIEPAGGLHPDARPADLIIKPAARIVLRRGQEVQLTRLEFDLLLFLAQRPRQVVRRRTLLAEVWGIDHEFGNRTLDVHVRRLREKLGPESIHITTVRGVGYRFDGGDDVVRDDHLPEQLPVPRRPTRIGSTFPA